MLIGLLKTDVLYGMLITVDSLTELRCTTMCYILDTERYGI